MLRFMMNQSRITVTQLIILSLMNKNQPVQLREKIDYLREKIEYLNQQVKYSGNFELKMKFLEFIDTTIQRVYHIQEKKQYSSQAAKSRYQEQYKSEENEIERRRLEKEKQDMAKRLRQLDQRQKQMEVESLKIELENARVLKNSILKEASAKENQLKVYISELQKKIKAQQREIQKIGKMNGLQAKEIQNLKEERNRAEKKELQWKQRYENDVRVLQTFHEKKNKYLYRHQQGLKIVRSIINATSDKKGCERYCFCDLPLKFHIIKIVYGIKIGMINNKQQIEYFDEISLYEKQDMQMTYQEGELSLVYIKRKVTLKLKYKPPKNQIVIMLFGKGDSVGLDQSK